MTGTGRARIVSVGCGFGGLFAAKALGRTPADVLVIERNNYQAVYVFFRRGSRLISRAVPPE